MIGVLLTSYKPDKKRIEYVKKAIISLDAQTKDPDEFCFVSDYITGETKQPNSIETELETYKRRHPSVKYTRLKYGGTIGEQLVYAISNMKSDYIIFLDDDDTFNSDKINIVSKALESSIDIAFIHNDREYIDENDNSLGYVPTNYYFEGQLWNKSAITIKKSIIDLTVLSKITNSEDNLLGYFALASGENIISIRKILTYYRFLKNSAFHHKDPKDIYKYYKEAKNNFQIMEKYFIEAYEKGKYKYNKDILFTLINIRIIDCNAHLKNIINI
ncbi:glycosyltransferase [Mycobacterium sp.]|uniref:glycosyltransferase n=1 Tax=Mycobacterium sp. TaxID=1785 RepID=UPI0031DCAD4C